ncbi:MAG: hypothetical protein IT406_01415 [Candidatus Yanofskybacteria bacterium]|nr:hypothetical protein [Candidatus Yanofskybacteria bacterium]
MTTSNISRAASHESVRMIPHAESVRGGYALVNGVLAVLAVAALVCYVVQANALAAHAWEMRDAQAQLAEARDVRTTLVAEQSSFDNRQHLTDLAAQLGMVPAGDVVYLTPERPVAAR